MKFKLNRSPHLRMKEITKKLFNNEFLSDIKFMVEGEIINAHSLELMKRSVIFEEQLTETWGERQIIHINNFKYDNFLEFLRFIYTDDCTIDDSNRIELLQLAVKYQVISLENRILNSKATEVSIYQLFEYCAVENYEIAREQVYYRFANNFGIIFSYQELFFALHPDAVSEILSFEKVRNVITEIVLFNELAKWIINYCQKHQMSLTEGKQKFDYLIKKIRFPTLSADEVSSCAKNYPDLLTDTDCRAIGGCLILKSPENHDWIVSKRSDWSLLYNQQIVCDQQFITTLSVTKDTILHGFWIGVDTKTRSDIEIEITEKDFRSERCDVIKFIQSDLRNCPQMVISLGDSLLLKPRFKYTITIKYLINPGNLPLTVACRCENVKLMLHDPENSIESIEPSDNMLEMIFKKPPN